MSAPIVTYYVVFSKQAPDIGGSVRPISRLLKEDEQKTREKLLTETFEVAARFAKRPNAEGLQGQLAALGVKSFIISDQNIRGHLLLFAATASKGEGGMAFRDFSDKPLYCPFDDLSGIVVSEVSCEDGKETTLIDLHRKSANITPRLDVNLFDFAQMLGREDATRDDFLKELSSRSNVVVDRRFARHKPRLAQLSRDFGSQPTMFEPPPAMLLSPYLKEDLLAVNLYTLLMGFQFAAKES